MSPERDHRELGNYPLGGLGRVCPDCRCVMTPENTRNAWNGTRYCDYCLLERAMSGERIPAVLRPGTSDEDAEESAKDPMFFHLCQRCGGTGQVILTAWQHDIECFACQGLGVATAFGRSVQRWQRWTATYQSNKAEEVKGHKPVR